MPYTNPPYTKDSPTLAYCGSHEHARELNLQEGGCPGIEVGDVYYAKNGIIHRIYVSVYKKYVFSLYNTDLDIDIEYGESEDHFDNECDDLEDYQTQMEGCFGEEITIHGMPQKP